MAHSSSFAQPDRQPRLPEEEADDRMRDLMAELEETRAILRWIRDDPRFEEIVGKDGAK